MEILNSDDLKILRNKLINPEKDYPMKRLQDDLNCEEIAKFSNKLWKLSFCGEALSNKECNYIHYYFESIVDNIEIEKINHGCFLINNSPNGI